MWYIYRPDALAVWNDKEVIERLRWYYEVMNNEKPAKYLICKRLGVDLKLENASYDDLWSEHERLSEVFRKTWQEIKENRKKITDLPKPDINFLDLKVEIAYRILEKCSFCERRCGVNRARGEKGFCKLDKRAYVSSYFHHVGEEAPLVPSGTIFFCGCNSACVFCQNHDISQEWITDDGLVINGVEITATTLAIIMEKLRKDGARNINFVGGDPIPNTHIILEAMKYTNVNVPMLWNSNFYMSTEVSKLLIEVIDIGLPDFKYGNNDCAIRLSKLPRYFEVVSRNHKMFHEAGIDMIIRHLVLPNHVECCTKRVLEWISENCQRALVNVMEQYRPEFLVARRPDLYPDISRRPSRDEMKRAYKYATEFGLVWKPVS